MRNALIISAIVTLIMVAAAALWVAQSVSTAREDLRLTQEALAVSVDSARVDLLKESIAWRTASDRQATSYRAALERQIAASRAALIAELRPVAQEAAETVAAYREIPEALQPVIDETQRTVAAARPVLDASDRAVRLLTPQALGLVAATKVTAGETATTMREFRRATPEFIATAQQFSRDSAGVAANLNKLTHPRWYDRLLGYGLNGAVIYRNLNPATNLTVRGAQIIASRP